MSDEVADQAGEEKPKPTPQQEFNLAAMEAIRHVAEWCVKIKTLATHSAILANHAAMVAGDHEKAEQIKIDSEEVRKAGLRYHNAAMDMWEAFQKDAGNDLVTPRKLTRVQIDD